MKICVTLLKLNESRVINVHISSLEDMKIPDCEDVLAHIQAA